MITIEQAKQAIEDTKQFGMAKGITYCGEVVKAYALDDYGYLLCLVNDSEGKMNGGGFLLSILSPVKRKLEAWVVFDKERLEKERLAWAVFHTEALALDFIATRPGFTYRHAEWEDTQLGD
jgi:hypothetical protein